MFAYIKGILEIKSSTYVVIDVGGVGFKIFMSENAIETLGEIGEIVKVYTYHHVREDNISLYGFKTDEELRMFELLLAVSGVGAKSALIILSNITPSSFALAVISNDTSKLVKVPGIGAKTAARIVLELKDKLKTEEAILNNSKKNVSTVEDEGKINEVISALQVLGYTRKEIEKSLDKIDTQSLGLEDIIKKALLTLGR